jgi:WD40 repeat protein
VEGKTEYFMSKLKARLANLQLTNIAFYSYADRIYFSPNNKYIITTNIISKKEALRIWDIENGKLLKSFSSKRHEGPYFSNDQRFVIKLNKKQKTLNFYEIK